MMTYLECKVTCNVQYKNAKVYARCNALMTFLHHRTSVRKSVVIPPFTVIRVAFITSTLVTINI